MANLKEKLLGLMDTGVSQAMKLVDSINETIDGIDWDEQFESLNSVKDSLIEKGNSLLSDFNELPDMPGLPHNNDRLLPLRFGCCCHTRLRSQHVHNPTGKPIRSPFLKWTGR